MTFHARLQILARAKVYHVCNFHVMELLCHSRHCALEYNGFANCVTEHNAVAVMDHTNRLLRRHRVLFIVCSPIHFSSLPRSKCLAVDVEQVVF